jgi:hypothetical protein
MAIWQRQRDQLSAQSPQFCRSGSLLLLRICIFVVPEARNQKERRR